ncbi:hypothetical protein CDL12_25974 [Handroanthus impetiginosus]|uniref:Uncharacterized protein n=1 Tax=Handroanthus impetiginosus TaxID=429701 RepID=A0A2G9G895_9LAMI|nr:hypothetical protein CDL12_25974 [Handroanthus impetiginosus]
MLLQYTGWMDAFYSCEVEVTKLKDQKAELEDKLKSIQDSWDQETAANRGKLLSYERQIYELQKKLQQLIFEKEETYERGQSDGKKNFLRSSEYGSAIKQAQLDGAIFGFYGMSSQIERLGGFKDGFDVGELDVTKTADLKDYAPNEDSEASTVDDEFAILLQGDVADEENMRSPRGDADEKETRSEPS